MGTQGKSGGVRVRRQTPAIHRWLAAAVIAVLGGGAAFAASPAQAETIAYELTGTWVDQPASVVSGLDVLGAVWKFDVNDDRPAPSNDPVANNVLTVDVEYAKFTKIPSTCVTSSPDAAGNDVAPLSSLSADGRTLVCNVGTRDQGTAELTLTGLVADGVAGQEVGAKAQFRGLAVDLPKIPIVADFAMDAKFDKGAPLSQVGAPTANQFISFPFSLSHQIGAVAGPDSVSFDLTVKESYSSVDLRTDASCVALDRRQPEYPFSAAGFPAEQTTNFPTCTLVKTSSTTFTLTLSGLDYSGSGPRLESNGQPLPLGMNVIAAGDLLFQVPWTRSSQVSLVASTPTYVATDGSQSVDKAANNSNAVPITRGSWTGAWVLSSQKPEGFGGAGWSDTYRAPAGASVMSMGGVAVPPDTHPTDHWVCKVLDTEFVTFEGARVGYDLNNSYYDDSFPGDIWYYTGEMVLPNTTTAVDPNLFECGTKTQKGVPAAGNQPGWSTTPPADLSTVKAVKLQVTSHMGVTTTIRNSLVYLIVDQRIKETAPLEQDIWTWTSILSEGKSDWTLDLSTQLWLDRTMDDVTAQQALPGVRTPGLRYPYTGPGRDALRVVGSLPIVQKDVLQKEYGPGTTADYQVRFGLETVLAEPDAAQVVVTDTLPVGLSYVAGSAETEPTITGTSATGQKLVWVYDDVMPNAPFGVINFKASVPDDAAPGATYTNKVTAASQGNTRSASAVFIIPDSGYTVLTKDTRDLVVGLVDGGATNAWTLTLESHDPNVSEKTDFIDILPHLGDGRGSHFSGALTLDGEVQAPDGAVVYYTSEAPETLDEDPGHASNGGFATPSGIWSTVYSADATAIRVIGGVLKFRDVQEITLPVRIEGAEEGDAYVNTAVARTASTELRMRTSALFTVAVTPSLSWAKVGTSSATDYLAGSEWELIQVTGDAGSPSDGATSVTVMDCIAATEGECGMVDVDPRAGRFTVSDLDQGWYRLTETVAPEGYQLDSTPKFILVDGATSFEAAIVNVPTTPEVTEPTPTPEPTPEVTVAPTPPATTGVLGATGVPAASGGLAVTGAGGVSQLAALASGLLLAGGALFLLRRRTSIARR